MPYCNNCGAEIESFHQFCRGCGVSLAGTPPAGELIRSPAQRMLDVIPAGKGLRFANLIVDTVIYSILTFIVGMFVGSTWGEAGARFFESVLGYVSTGLMYLFYYIALEHLFGRTIGKMVTGTKVVNEFGDKATIGQIAGRSFARFIPFEVFSFLGDTGRGWHDSLPKTYVIKYR